MIPPTNGSAARTVGIARLMVRHFGRVTIRCFSSTIPPDRHVDGLEVRHLPRPATGVSRLLYLAEALLAPSLGFRFSDIPRARTLVQLESPLLFEAAGRAGLGRFVLNAHNIYQDLATFPQASFRDRVFYRLTRRRQARMEAACWTAADHVVFCSAEDRDRADDEAAD